MWSEGVIVLLQRLWEWQGLVQREGQARSPTKSEWDSAVLERLVQARDGGEAIPPVVARIFSGDSTSPLTREASLVLGIVRKISLMVRMGSNPHRHGSEYSYMFSRNRPSEQSPPLRLGKVSES